MKLVIAEKPSVAQSLAAVIGANIRKDGYLEGNGWRVSWCVGHLAGLADADAYNPDYAKWRYDDLPILPEPWQMVVSYTHLPMAYVPVPKDLTKVKTKVAFNLTKRQLICFGCGALIGVPLFFLLRGPAEMCIRDRYPPDGAYPRTAGYGR